MKRADWLLLALLLGFLPWLYVTLWADGQSEGEYVRITAAGQTPISLPLDRDGEVAVHGPLGDSIIEVRDGKARFKDSPCSGKVCIHAGWLHAGGEFAACLPNHVAIEITGGTTRYDSINF